MTIREQAKLVADALKDWAESNHGSAHVAGDVIHLLDLLRTKPGAPKAGVLFATEDPRGDSERLGRVDRTFKVVISRGRGLKILSGESLTEGASGGKPMFDLVEEAREIVLALRTGLEGEDAFPQYKGSRPFEVNGLILDAYEINFAMAAQNTVQVDEGVTDGTYGTNGTDGTNE